MSPKNKVRRLGMNKWTEKKEGGGIGKETNSYSPNSLKKINDGINRQ